jgi:hypothetical protein
VNDMCAFLIENFSVVLATSKNVLENLGRLDDMSSL